MKHSLAWVTAIIVFGGLLGSFSASGRPGREALAQDKVNQIGPCSLSIKKGYVMSDVLPRCWFMFLWFKRIANVLN